LKKRLAASASLRGGSLLFADLQLDTLLLFDLRYSPGLKSDFDPTIEPPSDQAPNEFQQFVGLFAHLALLLFARADAIVCREFNAPFFVAPVYALGQVAVNDVQEIHRPTSDGRERQPRVASAHKQLVDFHRNGARREVRDVTDKRLDVPNTRVGDVPHLLAAAVEKNNASVGGALRTLASE